jgi:hypothetical protein
VEATVNMKMAPQELALLVRALKTRRSELTADINARNFEPAAHRDAKAEVVQITALLEKLT